MCNLNAAWAEVREDLPIARNIILMIGDGMGIKQIEAANAYTKTLPEYQAWKPYWMSTFLDGGSYDPQLAWSNFDYVKQGATSSPAAATTMYSGVKVARNRIGVSTDGHRLFTIADKARLLHKAIGAVSTVQVSHATLGAWYAHNDHRFNTYAIADEGFFGDPNTTRRPLSWTQWLRNQWNREGDLHTGSHGLTLPSADVIIGATGVGYIGEKYSHSLMRDKLFQESGKPGKHVLVESIAGSHDASSRLFAVASDSQVTKLAGLFTLMYSLADDSGYHPESPSLADMTRAALTVLNRNPKGFVLLVEGGLIDWSGHSNNMHQLLGEQINFNKAVQAVIDWVVDSHNRSSWTNTLVIITSDHETGYLTARPGVFPDQPLGEISDRTLAKEKLVASTDRRASWEDLDGDSEIDEGETVYWAWNKSSHTNSLVPLYTKGVGSELFAQFTTGSDPVRGAYLDNAHIHKVMDTVTGVIADTDNSGVDMVVVPAGHFWMGCNPQADRECRDDEPSKVVYLDPFVIDQTEVTIEQYDRCVRAGHCSRDGLTVPRQHGKLKPEWSWQCNWGETGRGDHPVNCVTWYQAQAFCTWRKKRLPREAEWEKAARGQDGRKYTWGNQSFDRMRNVANISDETARFNNPDMLAAVGYNDGFYTTAPVGSFPQGVSPYGALDMLGNVWEWTADLYDAGPNNSWKETLYNWLRVTIKGQPEPSTIPRVVRGASWKNPPTRARVSHRAKDLPNDRYGNSGFRCAASRHQ